jgi:hypothetical protein
MLTHSQARKLGFYRWQGRWHHKEHSGELTIFADGSWICCGNQAGHNAAQLRRHVQRIGDLELEIIMIPKKTKRETKEERQQRMIETYNALNHLERVTKLVLDKQPKL